MEGEDEGREGCGFLGRGFGMATRQAGRAATGAVSPIVVGRGGNYPALSAEVLIGARVVKGGGG